MAEINKLIVSSEEQWLQLSGGYSADIKFDYIYKRWYYDLYNEGVLMYAGIPLTKDCPTLKGISSTYLAVLEDLPNPVEYEPFNELGSILALIEVVE